MDNVWKWTTFILLFIVIILYVLNVNKLKFTKRVCFNSAIIDARVLDKLNKNVKNIILVRRPMNSFKFITTFRASHVAIICIMEDCNVLLSVGGFNTLYAREAIKNDDCWLVSGYGGPLKDIAEYSMIKEVPLMDIIREFITIRNARFDYLTNNCHHMTSDIIKRFCIYEDNDTYLRCPYGWNLVRECLFGRA